MILCILQRQKSFSDQRCTPSRSFLARLPCIKHTVEVVATFLYHFLSLIYWTVCRSWKVIQICTVTRTLEGKSQTGKPHFPVVEMDLPAGIWNKMMDKDSVLCLGGEEGQSWKVDNVDDGSFNSCWTHHRPGLSLSSCKHFWNSMQKFRLYGYYFSVWKDQKCRAIEKKVNVSWKDGLKKKNNSKIGLFRLLLQISTEGNTEKTTQIQQVLMLKRWKRLLKKHRRMDVRCVFCAL